MDRSSQSSRDTPDAPFPAARPPTRPSPSIRSRLLWLVAVVIGPVGILFAVHASRDLDRAEHAAEERVLAVASETAAGIQQFYDLSRRSVTTLSAQFGERLLTRESCRDVIGPAFASVPYLVNLVVFDARGDLVCGGVEGDSVVNVSDRQWFLDVAETDFLVGEPAVGRVVGTWVVPLASAIRTDGGFRGAVAGTVELERFQELIASFDNLSEGLLTVTTRGNVVMARSADAEAWIGRMLPVEPSRVDEVDAGHAITRSLDADGTPRIFGRIDLVGPAWRVFVGIPEAAAFAETRTALLRELLWMLVLVGLAFGLAILIQRGISRSLTALARGVQRAANGLPVELPPTAPPEVSLVATQLNHAVEERRRAQESEAVTRGRLDRLIDNAVFGIVVTSREGKLLRSNRAYAQMLGYDSVEELTEVGPTDLHVDPVVRRDLMERYPPGSVIRNEEVRLRGRDGAVRLVRLNGRAELAPDGQDVLELIAEDVTKERELEEITRHQQKMDAVGRLAGGVAHEFNNLLTVMGVNAEFLNEAMEPSSTEREEIDQIATAVDRAKSLTRKLLAFSRKEIVQPTRADLSTAVADFQGMLRRVIPENVAIDMELAEGAGPVHVDVVQVEQAILNLVINARDAMPGGGRVRIRTELRTELPEPVTVTAGNGESSGPWAVIVVSDDGPGIEEELRPLVFEPFFTTKPPGEGTGLGLPTVYGIVSEAGGHVTLDSHPGEGATVTLWFPIVGS